MTERETLLAEIAERQARLAELDAQDALTAEAIDLVVNDDVSRTAAQTAAIREGRAGKEKVNLALAALRRGMELANAPPMGECQPRWPSVAELHEMATESAEWQYSPYSVAKEMARRIRAYQTGEQP